MNSIVIPEIFQRKTLKRVESIFNLEEEKIRIKTMIKNGEWFTIAGLRRTGKTTLARSVAVSTKIPTIYVNVWELSPYKANLNNLINMLLDKIRDYFEGRISKISKRIYQISILGVSITFNLETPSKTLSRVIEAVIKNKKRLILIIDEAQDIDADFPKLIRYLAALHDEFAPELEVILLGSIISMKEKLDKIKGEPMYGRMTREIILKPFDRKLAINFLKEGFRQAGISIEPDVLYLATEHLGGFPGWLADFGRRYIEEYQIKNEVKDPAKIIEEVYLEAKTVIYKEIARLLIQRKKLMNYIRVLKEAAVNITVTPSHIARVLGIKRNTAMKYLTFLKERGIMDSKDGNYYIVDPLIRKALTEPDAIEKIKYYL